MPLINLKVILADAAKHEYAVGLFNILSLEMARGIIEAAERKQSPVIMGVAEAHLPIIPLEYARLLMAHFAAKTAMPICLHFDHGMDPTKIRMAIDAGLTSVMYDGSALSFEQNIENTLEIVRYAHERGVSVEAELGRVGGGEDGSDSESFYTEVDKVEEFVGRTGVDALAVSIGTVHGPYRKTPHLDLQRLADIKKITDVPLVLHGGSGLSDDDFRNTVAGGIRKVNICTDMCVAALGAAKRNDTYEKAVPEMCTAVAGVVGEKMRLFGSAGRVR